MGLIKKYETGELIGTGSMGSVYRARDIVLERDVALKILHSRGDLDPELKERFYREARTGANLRHPNVIVVYELDEYNGVPFMAMELLNGADLRRYITERRPMSLAQKVELFTQICDGLGEAHRRGIVHRDIKPSNIFVQDDGTAKILDFGIARVSSSKLTVAGKVLGTPNYMAPEQINRRQCDSRSDLFSAAIVFFEFLVYSHPFQSAFIPRRIVEGDPDSLFERDPLIPEALADLIYLALQKKSESRIQTAEEFAAGLRAVLQELRTGVGAAPIIQTLGSATLPDQTPVPAGNPDSPEGRLATFVQLMSDFEAAVQMGDATAARTMVANMGRLESVDQRFTDALRDCRGRLERLQSSAPPAEFAATAGVGGTSTAQAFGNPVIGSEPAGAAPAGRVNESWGTEQGVYSDQTVVFRGQVPEPWNPETPEGLSLLCESCGAHNRDTATYCHECGRAIGGTGAEESASPAGAQTGSLVGEGAGEKPASAREDGSIGGSSGVEHKRSAIPRTALYAIGGGLAVCCVALALWVFLVVLKPIPIEKAVGTARVRAAETAMFETQAPWSDRLMTLRKGTALNILSRITGPGQRLVRVQVVTPKPRRPGYVALADLGELSSGDAAIAWEFLSLSRPGEGAEPEATRIFDQALAAFSEKFPGTPQARMALLEQVRVHLGIAEQAKAAGKDRSEWQGDLDQAGNAIKALGITASGPDEEKQLLAKFQEFGKEEKTETQPGPDAAEVAALLTKASAAWHGGDVDSCETYAKKVLTIEPNNKVAQAWLWQVAESRKQ